MGIDDDDDVTVLEDADEDDLDLSNAAHDASIIKFVNQIMAEALESRATDVHVEPFENQLRVRYRIDGVLVEANIPPQVRKYHAAIVSRIEDSQPSRHRRKTPAAGRPHPAESRRPRNRSCASASSR